jgi:murein tripeptide amidase MpaA
MKISTQFDSGSIEIISLSENGEIRLNLRKDTQSDIKQWFHFRLTGAMKKECFFSIENAGNSSYPEGWENYHVVASYDKEEWFRIPTTYTDGILRFDWIPVHNSMYFAYFAPYSYQRHQELVHDAQLSDFCKLEVIGETFQGRDIDMLTIGDENDQKKKIWLIARQHPGESMAEWFIEGFLNRILDENDPVSRTLLQKTCFYVVPNANIDGSILGNLRVNAAGRNLNREWAVPDKENSPEVYHILNKMIEKGVDMSLDVHGDEALPYVFVSGTEGVPSYNAHIKQLEDAFKTAWIQVSPNFQDTHHYPLNAPGTGNLAIACKQIGERFKCLSYTIEMPFKDNANLPDELYGWSDERSVLLGKSVLNPILAVVDNLR